MASSIASPTYSAHQASNCLNVKTAEVSLRQVAAASGNILTKTTLASTSANFERNMASLHLYSSDGSMPLSMFAVVSWLLYHCLSCYLGFAWDYGCIEYR